MENTKEPFLLRIGRHLLLNASFLKNLGLMHGKMGIILFFCHYARYTQNKLYEDFAGELLDEVYKEIHNHIYPGLENGLAGIGWGMEYMIQNEFMEGETNEVLEELDGRLMEQDIRRIADLSFQCGLGGILYYVMCRLNSPSRNRNCLPFDACYLSDLHNAACRLLTDDSVEEKTREIAKRYINRRELDIYRFSSDDLKTFLTSLPDNEDVIAWPLGLADGCAGVGLKIILS